MIDRRFPSSNRTAHSFRYVAGGVTAPRGFLAAGLHAGIKKPPLPDLALIASVKPGPVAALFTTNQVAAASVQLGRRQLKAGLAQAIVVNSGNANACTGRQGVTDAETIVRDVAQALKVSPEHVCIGSTGVIGQRLPLARIRRAIPRLVRALSPDGHTDAARAILTTDKTIKEVAVSVSVEHGTLTIGGMAKGSGMIHPDMATMLAYVTTDAAVERGILQRALRIAADQSFNCISVDGDTSTNDTVLCLANGLAGHAVLRSGSRSLGAFQEALNEVCRHLALKICEDGEGVTKIVEIQVAGARTQREARRVANTIATSSLVKTALYGEDANWGRIMAAVGRAGVRLALDRLSLTIAGIPIVKNGSSVSAAAERRLARAVRQARFTITVRLGLGTGEARIWTTDLSHDYVTINASYRS